MKITLNGEARDLPGPSVSDALTQIGLGTAKVATALNGNFLPAAARAWRAMRWRQTSPGAPRRPSWR